MDEGIIIQGKFGQDIVHSIHEELYSSTIEGIPVFWYHFATVFTLIKVLPCGCANDKVISRFLIVPTVVFDHNHVLGTGYHFWFDELQQCWNSSTHLEHNWWISGLSRCNFRLNVQKTGSLPCRNMRNSLVMGSFRFSYTSMAFVMGFVVVLNECLVSWRVVLQWTSLFWHAVSQILGQRIPWALQTVPAITQHCSREIASISRSISVWHFPQRYRVPALLWEMVCAWHSCQGSRKYPPVILWYPVGWLTRLWRQQDLLNGTYIQRQRLCHSLSSQKNIRHFRIPSGQQHCQIHTQHNDSNWSLGLSEYHSTEKTHSLLCTMTGTVASPVLGTLTKPNVGEHTQDNNSWVSMAADELRMRLLLCQRSIHSFPTHHNSNMSHM